MRFASVSAWIVIGSGLVTALGCESETPKPQPADKKESTVTKSEPSKETATSAALLETKRLIVRKFTADDWQDFHELAVDWKKAPGPDFDKWPTSEAAARESVEYMANSDKFYALCLRDPPKVIGLLGLNGLTDEGHFDLGHVILSKHQDNDLDREALAMMVKHIFESKDVQSIVTHNADHPPQLAPLKSLGFKVVDPQHPGALVLTRTDWNSDRAREGEPGDHGQGP
jgi:RimJ/RimL family protein N-acetyltransferase